MFLYRLLALFVTLSFSHGFSTARNIIYTVPHATHQHILRELVNKTDGPIIEFGCGYYSTDLLHALCQRSERLLITLDDDVKWLEKFKRKYLGKGYEKDNSGWHKFFFVPGKKGQGADHWKRFLESEKSLSSLRYAICFVDQSPWLARYETIQKFKNLSQYVVLHDCNYFPEKGICGKVIHPLDRKAHKEGVFDFSDIFPFFQVYYPKHPWPGDTGPPTLVGSLTEETLPEVSH